MSLSVDTDSVKSLGNQQNCILQCFHYVLNPNQILGNKDLTKKKPCVVRIPTRRELPTVTHLAKRPAVNLDFTDLTYTTSPKFSFKTNEENQKKILHAVSGSFHAGELTAIMGTSGAGKTTLLNILAGYLRDGVTGSIDTNGHPRQIRYFRKLISYIMQEDVLQPHLSVLESMRFAADLKLGNELTKEQKQQTVDEILEVLGLTSCRDTRTEQLSGGQRRRLSVAQELVNNPPIMFLDEPTTGLDVVSSSQMVHMLQKLARQGRTIICTIHQPSASQFEQFDLVYVMANGSCVFQGSPKGIIPFLALAGLQCPLNHNPADFIIEVITAQEHLRIRRLSSDINNGKIRLNTPKEKLPKVTKLARQETVDAMPPVFSDNTMVERRRSSIYYGGHVASYPTTFSQQMSVLVKRKFLQQSHNTTSTWILFSHYMICSLLVGGIFAGVGSSATRPFENFKCLLCTIVFFMYTHVMCNVLLFPFEIKRFQREYLNRWYGLKAYFTAQTIVNLPLHLAFSLIFVFIVYWLTEQPLEWQRILWFWVICCLSGLASEGLGLTIGSIFSATNGCIVGPASVVPLLALAMYGAGFGPTVETFMKVLMSFSYLRSGVEGLSLAVYGNNRGYLKCNDEYCHYRDPDNILRDIGSTIPHVYIQACILATFALFYRITAYVALRTRLTRNQSSNHNLINIARKLLRLQ